jgi:hypothetical protein
VTSGAPSDLDQRLEEIVMVDVGTADIVMAESRRNTSTSSTVLSRYVLDGATYHPAFSCSPDAGAPVDLGVLHDHVVLVFGDHALLVDKSGNTLATYTHPSADSERLLSFDESYVYFAGNQSRRSPSSP